MNLKRYCKECGNEVEFKYDPNTTYCDHCKREITRKETIAGYTRDARVSQLKAMHNLMLEANDERIYMTWIYMMPDCPSEEDFIDIALDDKQYNECFDLFVKLIANKGCRY